MSGAGQEAEGRPSRCKATGLQAREAHSWLWETSTSPLPGWHLGRGVRLPMAMSPASRPSLPLLPGWEGGWTSLVRARVSVCVSSMCILRETAGGGAREVHVSMSAGLPSALMYPRL